MVFYILSTSSVLELLLNIQLSSENTEIKIHKHNVSTRKETTKEITLSYKTWLQHFLTYISCRNLLDCTMDLAVARISSVLVSLSFRTWNRQYQLFKAAFTNLSITRPAHVPQPLVLVKPVSISVNDTIRETKRFPGLTASCFVLFFEIQLWEHKFLKIQKNEKWFYSIVWTNLH